MIITLGQSSGLALFFHIIKLLIYPVFLAVLIRSLGYSILSRVFPGWNEYDRRITLMTEAASGLFVFSVALLILASLGWYTLT